MRSGSITVLKTVRLNRGSNGSLHFWHRPVLEHKRTVMVRGSRVFRSDRTVRSGFQNIAYNQSNNINRGKGRGHNTKGRGRGPSPSSSQFNQFFSQSQCLNARAERPVCQICGKAGHTAIDYYHKMDYAYQGKHPPSKLAATVTSSNLG